MQITLLKRLGWLPALFLSVFLMSAAATTKAHANNMTPVSHTKPLVGQQIAWCRGGYCGYHTFRPWGGYYRPWGGYYRPSYWGGYRPMYGGYRPVNVNRCVKNCWRDRWGRLQCRTRCR